MSDAHIAAMSAVIRRLEPKEGDTVEYMEIINTILDSFIQLLEKATGVTGEEAVRRTMN